MSLEYAEALLEHWAGNPPRMFALIQEWDDDEDEDLVEREVVAYGSALPDGSATTMGPRGHGLVGHFESPGAASVTHCSDLVWLTPAH
jgi:hypothetical protein